MHVNSLRYIIVDCHLFHIYIKSTIPYLSPPQLLYPLKKQKQISPFISFGYAINVEANVFRGRENSI